MVKIIQNRVFYWCPACKAAHNVPLDDKRWSFNNDMNKPTITPSVKHFYTHPETGDNITVCHYHIKNGYIEFCNDNPHKLNGQRLKLEPIPEDYGLPT